MAAWLSACSNDDGGTPNGPCGANGQCPSGYTCEPKSNTCQLSSRTIDGGTTKTPDASAGADAKAADAGGGGGPDARAAADGGGQADAGGGGGPDAGGPGPVTTLTPGFDTSKPTNAAMVSFTFTANLAGATFTCKLDAQAESSCSSPLVLAPDEGSHTLTVTAHANGLTEQNPPSASFTIDRTPPNSTINAPADKATIGAMGTLVFSANELTQKFECAFDSGPFSTCGAGMMGSAPIMLPNGPHTASVRATDLAGNAGTAVSIGFTVDSSVLTVAIAPRATECAGEPIAFSATKSATFTCNLDGVVTDPCTSPFNLPSNIGGGGHDFSVTGKDSTGATNTQKLSFDVDRTAPSVTISDVQPSADAFGLYSTHGTITFQSSEPAPATMYNGNHGFLCNIDTDPQVDCTAQSPPSDTSFYEYSVPGEKVDGYDFHVVAFDACGNMGSNDFVFSVDATPPAPCLIDVRTSATGYDVQNGGDCLTQTAESGGNGTLTFTAEAGTYICHITTTGPGPAKLPDPTGNFNCAPNVPITFTNLTDFGQNGWPYVLTVHGIDVHGNESTVDLTWYVDTSPPFPGKVGVTSQVNTGEVNATYNVTERSNGNITEPPPIVTCTMDGVPCAVCGTKNALCEKASAGLHQVVIQATDVFGNKGRAVNGATVVTYGPNEGRAILMGHDFMATGSEPTAILRNAFAEIPWRKQGLFDRPARLATFDAGSVNSTERTNVLSAISGLYDGASVAVIQDTQLSSLTAALASRDLLLVYDQENSTASVEAGINWHDVLQGYLDDGGVVVVLDGLNSTSQSSGTYQILTQTSQSSGPLMDVLGESPFTTGNATTVFKLVDPAEAYSRANLSQPDYAPLLAPRNRPLTYAAPTGSVVFRLNREIDTSDNRVLYERHLQVCGDGCDVVTAPVIMERIFPHYTMSATVAPDAARLEFDVNPGNAITGTPNPDTTQGTFVCVRCDSAMASCVVDAACKTPSAPDTYTMSIQLIDPHGKVGNDYSTSVTVQPLSLEESNPSASYIECLFESQYPQPRLPATTWTFHDQICTDNTYTSCAAAFNFTPDATINASCGSGYQYSFDKSAKCVCGQYNLFTISAVDHVGNMSNVLSMPFQCASCPPR
jgi:hypothetical protein